MSDKRQKHIGTAPCTRVQMSEKLLGAVTLSKPEMKDPGGIPDLSGERRLCAYLCGLSKKEDSGAAVALMDILGMHQIRIDLRPDSYVTGGA